MADMKLLTRYFFSLLVLLCGTLNCFSQNEELYLDWFNGFTDENPVLHGYKSITELETDSLGNQYVIGFFNTSLNVSPTTKKQFIRSHYRVDPDFFVAKYSKSGALIWSFNIPEKEGNGIKDIEV